MNSRLQEFLNELFEGKDYSYIVDLESGLMYFNPQEILSDCGYDEGTIRNKVTDLPSQGKKFFTNDMVNSTSFLKLLRNPIHNTGQNWVTVYALIDLLQGRKPKATEIKNWLIYEVLPSIDKNGYYIDDNITSEQVANLEREIEELKAELITDRVKKPYGVTEIVKFINVKSLLSSSLFRYLAEVMGVGTYDRVNKNRVFVANEDFTERAIKIGIARGGKGRDILFYKEFADRFNACEECLAKLYEINQEELAIRDRGIEKRKKNMPF